MAIEDGVEKIMGLEADVANKDDRIDCLEKTNREQKAELDLLRKSCAKSAEGRNEAEEDASEKAAKILRLEEDIEKKSSELEALYKQNASIMASYSALKVQLDSEVSSRSQMQNLLRSFSAAAEIIYDANLPQHEAMKENK